MAKEIIVLDRTYNAGADLSGSQFLAVKMDTTNGQVVLAGDGDPAIGILQNKPTQNLPAVVRVLGVSELRTGVGNIAAGDLVSATSTGAGQTADSGDYVFAVCERAGTYDATNADLATVLLVGLLKI